MNTAVTPIKHVTITRNSRGNKMQNDGVEMILLWGQF